MNRALLDQIVNATLYEGYILYPYRPSSCKNSRERFTFGRVYPEAYSAAQKGAEPCVIQTECLAKATTADATVRLSVRFLHPMARESHEQTWLEAVEREVALPSLSLTESPAQQTPFEFPESLQMDAGMVRRQALLKGIVSVKASPLGDNLFKISVRVLNQSPVPDAELQDSEAMLLRLLASTHVIFHIINGEFISQTDPPAELAAQAATCHNTGVWPVLVGDESKAERDTMLSAPIILYDYPQIAPESAGQLFDGTEIDEILTLRILTMSDDEKREMRGADEQARRLLERTEALPNESLLKMHGMMRGAPPPSQAQVDFDDFFGASTRLEGVSIGGVWLKAGDRVRLRPKPGADIMDLALQGQTAIIEAVEQDLERKVHLSVVMENDPGKDLGFMRQPGHRFFYGVDEVEPLNEEVV